MKSPLVSIIIPCFNAAGTIRETLESVQTQTWPNFEIILVDDGSTDGTPEIAEATGVKRLRVVREEHSGGCAARNCGIALAKGDYFQFLDADDLLDPDKIDVQIKRLLSLPSDHAAYGAFDYIDGSGRVVRSGFHQGRDFSPGLEWLVSSLQLGFFVPPHSWLVPRCLVTKAGPWNVRLVQNQDGEYFSRILQHAGGVAWVKEAVCYYRWHVSDSVSQHRTKAADDSLVLAAELIEKRLQSSGLPDAKMLVSAVYLRALYRLGTASEAFHELWKRAVASGLPNRRIRIGGQRFRLIYRLFGWRVAFGIRGMKIRLFEILKIPYRR